uniref:Putative secreted protein n=1 Tax=Ixodes ricinus TaxID=34613 RepID=A0A6B0UC21_IXORI
MNVSQCLVSTFLCNAVEAIVVSSAPLKLSMRVRRFVQDACHLRNARRNATCANKKLNRATLVQQCTVEAILASTTSRRKFGFFPRAS